MKATPSAVKLEFETWLNRVKEDAQALAGLGVLAKLDPNAILRLAKQISGGEAIDADQAAAKQKIEPRQLLLAASALVSFFLNLPDGLAPKDALRLLGRRKIIRQQDATKLAGVVRTIDSETTFALGMKTQAAEIQAVQPTFPKFRKMLTRCALVAQFDREYTTDDDAPSYNPAVERFVSVVTVQIQLDAFGTDQRILMALTRDELRQVINRLLLAEKQLLSVEDTVAKSRITASPRA